MIVPSVLFFRRFSGFNLPFVQNALGKYGPVMHEYMAWPQLILSALIPWR